MRMNLPYRKEQFLSSDTKRVPVRMIRKESLHPAVKDFTSFIHFHASRIPLLRGQRPTWVPDIVSKVNPLYFNNGYVPIPGDNSCLFHSISKWWALTKTYYFDLDVKTTTVMAMYLREHVVDMMIRYPTQKVYSSGETIRNSVEIDEDIDLESYCERMRDPREWGGLIEIEVLSIILQTNIVVYQLNPETNMLEIRMLSGFGRKRPTVTLYLDGWGNQRSSHFSLLMHDPPSYVSLNSLFDHRPCMKMNPEIMLRSVIHTSDCVIMFIDELEDLKCTYETLVKCSVRSRCSMWVIVDDEKRILEWSRDIPSSRMEGRVSMMGGKWYYGVPGRFAVPILTYVEMNGDDDMRLGDHPLIVVLSDDPPCNIGASVCQFQERLSSDCYVYSRNAIKNTTALKLNSHPECFVYQING